VHTHTYTNGKQKLAVPAVIKVHEAMRDFIKSQRTEKLTVYGSMFSQPTRSVVSFCNINSIPFDFHNVDLSKGQHKTPEYLAINPCGQVPAIMHGTFNLAESAAIIAYLAEAYKINSSWWPADAHERAKINAYLHWHHNNTRKHAATLAYAKFIGPKFLGKPESTPE